MWKNTSVIVKRVPSLRLNSVGTETGSTTQKQVVYVRPPDEATLREQPRMPRRQYPPQHSMTWTAPGVGGADAAAAPDAAVDSSIAALVSGAASAWESEKTAAYEAGRAGRGGRGGRGDGGGRGMGRGGGRGDMGGPPPPGYVCFRCSVPGHWIQNCPTNGTRRRT